MTKQEDTSAQPRHDSSRLSAWSPLRHSTFAMLWAAMLISNVGSWMHDMSAGWLMTTLSPSPTMVSLVQAATTLPVCLFSLLAGAIADRVDRRRMLLITQIGMAIVAAIAGVLVLKNAMTEYRLLFLTFILGLGTAASSPVWQSIVPRLVPKEDLPSAVALGAVSINLSRAIGPAIGGVIIASVGMAWPFLVNAISFVVIIAALIWWKSSPATPTSNPATSSPPAAKTSILQGMRDGIIYVTTNASLRAIIIRAVAYFMFASAYWAFLPLIASVQLQGSSKLYGVLVGCIGAGAVMGAQFLPKMRARFGVNHILFASAVGTVLVMCVLATTHNPVLGIVACVLAGTTWLAGVSTFGISMQLQLPDHIRARGMAILNTVFYGALAIGSVFWGWLAEHVGIPKCLLVAAAGLLMAMVLTWRYELKS
jgi:MFS family permease